MAVGGVSACYYIASDDHSDSGNDDHDDPSDRGYRYLQDENDDYGNEEGDIAAKFRCSILGCFLLPNLFSVFFRINDEDIQSRHLSEEKAVK